MPNLMRENNEDEYSYTWRIGMAKENGELGATWEELLQTMNAQFNQEYGESVWRKRYAEGKHWQNVFIKYGLEEQMEQIRVLKRSMEQERIKLRDERAETARQLREATRIDETLEILTRELADHSEVKFAASPIVKIDGDNDLLVMLSDMHIGLDFDTKNGTFNTEVAKDRLNLYISEIIGIADLHQSKNCYVAVLGDNISGNIKTQVAIGNKENVVNQIKTCSKIISGFVKELSEFFCNVYVTGVNGNHSRITANKDEAVLAERLDNLVITLVQAQLSGKKNVEVFEAPEDGMGTYSVFDIRGKKYSLCHGDLDVMSAEGVMRLSDWLKEKPYAILMGHLHKPQYSTYSGINIYRCGSLCGSGDDYTIMKRLTGNANQTVCVCNEDGVACSYNVSLS